MRSFSVSLVFISLLISTALHAATYKWTDESGNVVYSQQPPKTGKYEIIKGLHHSKTPPPKSTSKPVEKSKFSSSGSPSKDDSKKSQPKNTAELESIRQKNCETAKKNVEVLTVYRRFKNEDGSVSRMDENERQKRLKEAQEDVNEFCN